MGVLRIFHGNPFFGLWLLFGIMHLEVLGDMLGFEGVWDDGGACLV